MDEEGVCPCGAVALLVDGVGAGRGGAAVDGRAARCVCDDHPVAEELGDDLDVRRLAAACARAGELEERRGELALLDVRHLDFGEVDFGQIPNLRLP